MCFTCHGGVKPSGFATAPVDIKRSVTGVGAGAGHRVKTAGGLLPVGSPLPCYECHNPHGSTRGNESMISDVLGASLTTTDGPVGVRQFCFTCHTTSDTGKGWDSVAATYTVLAAGDKVVGIPRTGGRTEPFRTSAATGRATHSRATCATARTTHAGGTNVHNPGDGAGPSHVSPTTSTCFGAGCHDVSKSLPTVHALYVGPGSEFPQYATTCELCHENQDPAASIGRLRP